MDIASLILGILAFICSFIPCLGVISYVPAILAIIFGIIIILRKQKDSENNSNKGFGIAGLVLAIVALLVVNTINSAVNEVLSNNTVVSNTIVSNTDTTASTNTNTTSSQPEQTTCSVGQSIQNNDLKVSFLSVNENFTGYNKYATVNSGCKIIKADFEFENISTSDQLASAYDFDCYADGYSCESFWSTEDSGFSSTISSGKKAKGSVYFQVPKDATNITLEYETNVWTGSKLTFVVK